MVERAVLLASLTPSKKSLKSLVIEANLRLVGLQDPHKTMRETTESVTEEIFPDPSVEVAQ